VERREVERLTATENKVLTEQRLVEEIDQAPARPSKPASAGSKQ
jgi:hypothetical protein